MSTEPNQQMNSGQDATVTMISIPADRAQDVLDFVASLEDDESDVRGHMLSLGVSSLAVRTMLTNCKLQTTESVSGSDQTWHCADVTTW